MWLVSFLSGWRALADNYYFPDRFEGRIYRFQSARVKQANFTGSINMGVDTYGLYLAPVFIFRLFHQPILIPWSDIQVEPINKFLFRGYKLSFLPIPQSSLEMHTRTFDKLIEGLKEFTDYRPGPASPRAEVKEVTGEAKPAPSPPHPNEDSKEGIVSTLLRAQPAAPLTPSFPPEMQNSPDDPHQEFDHLLGMYQVHDSRRLLEGLKRVGVPFELETFDQTSPARHHGSGPLKIWVKSSDQKTAEKIQARTLGIKL